METNDQLGGKRPSLKQRANDYALLIVDEAQAFRNPDTARAHGRRMARAYDKPAGHDSGDARGGEEQLWVSGPTRCRGPLQVPNQPSTAPEI